MTRVEDLKAMYEACRAADSGIEARVAVCTDYAQTVALIEREYAELALYAPPVPAVQAYSCKLHVNQRKSGSLCGREDCTACKPYRARSGLAQKPVTVPVAGPVPSATVLKLVPAEPAKTQLDYEVEASRRAYQARRDMFAAAALTGLLAGGVFAGELVDAGRTAAAYADALVQALDAAPADEK